MIHEDILYISYCKYLTLISNGHCKELHLDNFKRDFSSSPLLSLVTSTSNIFK